MFYVEHSDLRDKFQSKERITSMCKAIGEYTQSQIDVQVMPRGGSVRFEVIGNRVGATKEYILKEMCQVKCTRYIPYLIVRMVHLIRVSVHP